MLFIIETKFLKNEVRISGKKKQQQNHSIIF